ncbi:hypothetical protein [Falsihalocynthiibacter arcticus]|uniref:Uncharacterized protein n=1 Tax=Falsihalocynthiibacter arcticus TaxID=1579316 RepID=A0A126V1R7_9RHOB|nr:hypothetical protein [Falsihalocynthiibacter arcticus]AML52233.1 hypothetical protein RC74_13995 [Falsihalocynthiibacter arcticus]
MPHPIVNDPMLSQQWHLRNSGSGLFDLNIVGTYGGVSLWNEYTGAGINVFVIDNVLCAEYLADLASGHCRVEASQHVQSMA